MALDLEKPKILIDPLSGEADLEARQLRLWTQLPDFGSHQSFTGVRLISSYDLVMDWNNRGNARSHTESGLFRESASGMNCSNAWRSRTLMLLPD